MIVQTSPGSEAESQDEAARFLKSRCVGRASFLGTEIDLLSRRETLEHVLDAISARRRVQHCVVNVAKLVTMQNDAVLKRDVEQSDLVNVDGVGILWGARLLGIPVPERVTGTDLFQDLLQACEDRGLRPFLFGARQDVLEETIRVIKARHPGIEIAGYRNGYFGRAEEPEIAAQIRASKADMLFVAISSPVKERFIAEYRDRVGVPFLMGVGGSFDVISGRVVRAPLWMQRYGFEWLFRVIQEPKRMWKRYLFTNTVYAGLLTREVARHRIRRLFKRAVLSSQRQKVPGDDE